MIGAGSGLFDYALNAIRNEVVIDLRKRAASMASIFFSDAAVGGNKTREFYKTEDDLGALKDAALLSGGKREAHMPSVMRHRRRHAMPE